MKKIFVLLLGITCLGSFLRIWKLGNIPEGFYSDEALYGYEAYSLLKTGRDQFGNKYPLSIAGFGDYRPALYIYSTIPFVNSLGLNEFAVRLPSALFSSVTIFLVFLFVNELTRKPKTALFSALIFAISPWSLYLGRMAHETNLMTLLTTGGLYFLMRARRGYLNVFIATFLLGASLYAYHTARVFVPLILLLTLVMFRHLLGKYRKFIILGLLAFGFITLPLILDLSRNESWIRVKNVSFWNDPGVIPYINERRGVLLDKGVPGVVARIISNKATVYSYIVGRNFSSHLTPAFLLTQGDPNGIYNTPHTGILLWSEPILVVLGGWLLYKSRRRIFWWAILGIMVALFPDSLTRIAPSSPRIHVALPLVSLLGGVGFTYVAKKRNIFFILSLITIVSALWFWQNYLLVRPQVHERAWQIGAKEMVKTAAIFSTKYNKIWISRNGWGWIHVVFHTTYPPDILQKEINVSSRNDLGFWWVSDVGKYHLEWLPSPFIPDCGILYIATPGEFPEKTSPVHAIKTADGRDLYWFVDAGDCKAESI